MRSHFASICLLAVAAAKLTPRTDFKMANTQQPSKTASNDILEQSQNFIRGFYDHLDSRNDFSASDHQA